MLGMDSNDNIHTRIANIIADLPGIGKDSRMQGGGQSYSYRGIDDIMPHIKGLFAKHGVHMAPHFTTISDDTYEVERNGRTTRWRHVTVAGGYTFYGADGSHFTATTIGEGKDSADKAYNKAMTAALKYCLMQTLAIADGDDPDAYYPDDAPEPRIVSTKPQAPSALNELFALRDSLKAHGVYDDVVAFAANAQIPLNPQTPDADVQRVLDHARSVLPTSN
jgi:hypothetical protein